MLVAASLFAAPGSAAPDDTKTGTVSGTVFVYSGRGKRAVRKDVVVYLKGVPGKKIKTPKEIRQKDQHFSRDVTVVVVGSTIDFPNDDRVAHNVISKTPKFRDLDLGEYKGGESRSYKFRRTGEVDLRCNIHPRMNAKVKVVDSHYFAYTDAKGRFEIENVPAGTFEIVAWLPDSVERSAEVKVEADKVSKVRLQIQVGSSPSDPMETSKTGGAKHPY